MTLAPAFAFVLMTLAPVPRPDMGQAPARPRVAAYVEDSGLTASDCAALLAAWESPAPVRPACLPESDLAALFPAP
jgi:hypothetical protein